MNDELLVEWFNPDLFPNAPQDKRGGWVKLYGGSSILDAQQAFLKAGGDESKTVRLTWTPR